MFQLIKSYLPIIKDTVIANAKTINNSVKKGSKKIENFINRFNVISIALMVFVMYLLYKLIVFTIYIYTMTKSVDSNYAIIVTAIVGLATIFCTVYANNITKQNMNENNNKTNIEINESNNQTELGKKWIDSDGDGKVDKLVDCSNADEHSENLNLI